MKAFLTFLLMFLLATVASAQVMADFTWTQPDSTAGMEVVAGVRCCKKAILDGELSHYQIYLATATDTTYYGNVDAPYNIDTDVVTPIELQLYTPTSIRVRAIDSRERAGLWSTWSEAFTVDPGPPGAARDPTPVRVYFRS